MIERGTRATSPVLILTICVLATAPALALDVLIFDNNTRFQRAITAATNLSLPFTRATSADFVTQLQGGTAWDLVVLDLPSNEPTGAWQAGLEAFIAGGGRVIHTMWNSSSFTPTLQAAFEVTNTGSHQTQTFYRWNGHPLFTSPNTVDDTFDVWADIWGTNGFFLQPTGTAIAAAGFVASPAAGQAAIVIGNSNRTILNGFLFDDYDPADKDGDGKKDIVELIENEMLYILGPSCSITSPLALTVVDGDVTLAFDAGDPELDPLIATFQFSTDSGATYLPCTLGVGSPHTNPSMQFATPAIAEGFVWDSVADGVGFIMPELTTLRIEVVDGMDMGSCSVQLEVDNVLPLPSCLITAPPGTAVGDVPFMFDALSINSPYVDTVFEWSTDAGATWLLATAAASSQTPNPATGLIVGSRMFTWDSRTDGIGLSLLLPGVLMQLTVTDGIAYLPGVCVSRPFDVDNTRICGGICGDCNLSMGTPDVLDALAAAQIAVVLLVPTPEQVACCDVNASGVVDVVDALFIAQSASGLLPVLTCI